jgi:type I restriction enzyme M protein
MPIKKSELYSSLWASCDELRGGMDASQYKDYVLVLLFIKYISDKYADVPYASITVPKGASSKDMADFKNRLRAQDIHKIVDVFGGRLDVPKYSRMVPFDEIERNEFNPNIPHAYLILSRPKIHLQ